MDVVRLAATGSIVRLLNRFVVDMPAQTRCKLSGGELFDDRAGVIPDPAYGAAPERMRAMTCDVEWSAR